MDLKIKCVEMEEIVTMRKLFALAATLVMVMAFSMVSFAEESPSGEVLEPVTEETVSPKTADGSMLTYAGLSAASLAAIAAAAMKKSKAQA